MDLFLKPINELANVSSVITPDEGQKLLFVNYLNTIEGWKSKCKNLHWAAPHQSIHIYLDDFLGILGSYQDAIAEEYMGIHSKLGPNDIMGIQCHCTNAMDFIHEVLQGTINFMNSLPKDVKYRGISSETETFLHNLFKYKYLFSLCNQAPLNQ